ncbi:MAG: hypothetical protein EOO72_05015 [Myxococcaceae bacterium]|nr:MAG: hypothetical protein EOO72_05015 [Myxococcaceae bacterium]
MGIAARTRASAPRGEPLRGGAHRLLGARARGVGALPRGAGPAGVAAVGIAGAAGAAGRRADSGAGRPAVGRLRAPPSGVAEAGP